MSHKIIQVKWPFWQQSFDTLLAWVFDCHHSTSYHQPYVLPECEPQHLRKKPIHMCYKQLTAAMQSCFAETGFWISSNNPSCWETANFLQHLLAIHFLCGDVTQNNNYCTRFHLILLKDLTLQLCLITLRTCAKFIHLCYALGGGERWTDLHRGSLSTYKNVQKTSFHSSFDFLHQLHTYLQLRRTASTKKKTWLVRCKCKVTHQASLHIHIWSTCPSPKHLRPILQKQ